MQVVSLREFRTFGEDALANVGPWELALLSNRKGPAYFLIPVDGQDLALLETELLRVLAQTWLQALRLKAVGKGLGGKTAQIEARILKRTGRPGSGG